MANSSDFWERVQHGDREAMAALMQKYQSRILRRARGKLKAIGITAIDAEDIFSTCARRVDLMCIEGRFADMSECEVAGYVLRMAQNLTNNKILAERRHRRMLQRLCRESPHQYEDVANELDQSAIDSLPAKLCNDDREMLELWLRGMTHVQIADELGILIDAERKRWQRLRTRIRFLLAPPRDS